LRPLPAPDVDAYRSDIVAFAEAEFVIAPNARPITLEEHQQKILRVIFTAPHPQEVLYSAPKKSGKTTIAALISLYVALFFAAEGSEIIICAERRRAEPLARLRGRQVRRGAQRAPAPRLQDHREHDHPLERRHDQGHRLRLRLGRRVAPRSRGLRRAVGVHQRTGPAPV
jgi:hypothetical protein